MSKNLSQTPKIAAIVEKITTTLRKFVKLSINNHIVDLGHKHHYK